VRRATGAIVGLLAVAAAACGSQATRGYPLYPKLGAGPGRDKVAMLYGPIQTVDEQVVSGKGQTFELMPGCHVVTLQRSIGAGTANGAWAANVGRMVIAFEMRAGHSYTISSDMDDSTSPVGRVYIVAREKAPNGSMTRVPFARSNEDIINCQRWAESQGF
jgi:hypothetical protein